MIFDRDIKVQEIYNTLADRFNNELRIQNEFHPSVSYLRSRNIDKATIKKFKIGWCPETAKLKQEFEPLAGRLIFPIIDEYGNTVAFSGRCPLPKEQQPENVPKWWHEEYPKKMFLYNLNLAWQHILLYDFVVIVEGQCDVISCFKSFRNVVGALGTALTPEHFNRLSRFTKNIVLMLDPDTSGRKASERVMEQLKDYSGFKVVNVNIDTKNDHLDPDNFIQKYGCSAIKKFITQTAMKQQKMDLGKWLKWS